MISVAGYQILEKLYTGPNTETYRCARESDKQSVILKLPRDEYPSNKQIADLRYEYRLLKTLELPGVIKAIELIEQTHYPVLVLEDINGQSLQTFLASTTLNVNDFFKLALQLVDTIGALHQQNIIHKDIKPANIIIEPKSMQVKLIDLSISSKLTEENLNYISLNTLEGTLEYMSPEQTGRMNRPLDYRSDFYSLGITFFEMLTSERPFKANDPLEMVHCHIAKVPPSVRDINPQIPSMLAMIVSKLISKMPEERYASTVGLKKDLDFCIEQWQKQGVIPDFSLGQSDLHDHLQVSHQLYGRETQVKQVLAGFDHMMQQGRCELLLVAGYSGIGKTSVIKEVYKPIIRHNGYFITGKFDQLQRGMPYTAIIAAFQNLVKQVLTDSEERFAHIKQALKDALGNIGQVIIDLIPEVELIIGKQSPIPLLNPQEAQNRFNLVFRNFVKVFATADYPLVMFLDDLQWSDSASLAFIKNIFSDPDQCYLFLIAAYRDNEVQVGHILLDTLQHIQKSGIAIESIVLQPLEITDIENLLADTFSCERSKVTELATLLREKTLGNPFFICEFLKSLYQERHLRFSYEHGAWQWNMDELKQASMTHNVVELLTAQIHKLSEKTQTILKLAACIGHTFSLQTLIVISEQTSFEVATVLWEAMQARFIIAMDDSHITEQLAEANRTDTVFVDLENLYYQFAHDRIQHAVYSLISESTRQQVHLQIGRLLLKNHTLEENDGQLFTIVNHFDQSVELIIDPTERKLLAQYNVWAGGKAKKSAAYTAAAFYFHVAMGLLTAESWESDYSLIYRLYLEIAECEYVLKDFKNAESHIELLLKKATLLDKVPVYIVQINAFANIGKNKEALSIGVLALKTFGFSLSLNTSLVAILSEMIRIKWKIRGKKIPELAYQLSRVSAAHIIAIIQLLHAIIPVAYLVHKKLYAFIACRLINLGLTYGYNEEITFTFLVYSVFIVSEFNQIETAFDFIKLSKNIENQLKMTRPAYKNIFALGWGLIYWKYPLSESVAYLKHSYQIALEAGDIAFATYSCCKVLALYYIGERIEEVRSELEKIVAFCKFYERINVYYFFNVFYKITKHLEENLAVNDELVHLVESITDDSKQMKVFGYHFLCQSHFIAGRYDDALEMARRMVDLIEYSKATLDYPFELFFYALSLAACYKKALSREQKNYYKILKKIQKKFKLWAIRCPDNYEFLYLHLSAEIAQLENKIFLTMNLYDEAIASAYKYKRIQFAAIANERAAYFYLELNKPHLAKHYIQEAHYAYQRWGALAKCNLLEQQYPSVFQTVEKTFPITQGHTTTSTANATQNQSLDMIASLKSTLAISSEIHLDKLLKKLLQIMLEDAGAERCLLLCRQGEDCLIEAEGTSEKQVIFSPAQRITASSALPATIIGYVQRSGEPLIIADATHAEQTLADPYVMRAKPKSLFVFPIRYQGQLRRIFYLENNLTTNAFTEQHLHMLQVLGTQAAVSLENASLYYQATHDVLTGLANRNLLYVTFNNIVNQPAHRSKLLALLFIDLDYFKTINDTLGHEVGDKLLIYVAVQLKACLREGDLAVRLGGDEFVVMLDNLPHTAAIKTVVDKLYKTFSHTVKINEHDVSTSCSIGISVYPGDGTDTDTLLKHADEALYQAKEKGKNQYCFYQK